MKHSDDKFRLRSYRTAYGTTLVSITLVLFMLGILTLLVFQARELSDYLKENIGMQIEMHDDYDESQILKFKSELNGFDYTLRANYISKDEAARKLAEKLGEDFIDFIGYNPLPNSIELFLKSEYTHPDSVGLIKQQLLSYPAVKLVNYQESLLVLVNRNINRIGVGVVFFVGLMFFVSVLLVFNTIRLAVYAKRMTIKSMLLVGATQRFVRRPFVINGLIQGLVSGLVAVVLLWSVVLFIRIKVPELQILENSFFIRLLSLGMVLFGLLVTWLSNHFAIKKYLNINSEELY
ncbi:MAG: cell division protein FtsX [Bacteroidales bacterium]|nr:cell division protein FtsX [Bacteroidales bacterium]